jgi:tetratricopeptide (TPR) repeat protein
MWNEALANLKRVYAVDPAQSIHPLSIGMICEKQGDMKCAYDYYARTLAIDPDISLSPFYREFRARHPQAADSVLSIALRLIPSDNSPIYRARKGALHYFMGEYDQAGTHLTEAIAMLPDMNRPYYYLGEIAMTNGDTSRAMTLWNTSTTLDRNDKLVNARMGVFLLHKEPQRAKTMLQKALSQGEKSEPMYRKRQVLYPGMIPMHNSVLTREVLDYFDPEIDREAVRTALDAADMK